MPEPDVEVIVVGGGPAGSVTATWLAEAGHRVVLLDKASFPRHKACSEYLIADGARMLRDLGMEREMLAAGAHRLEAMRVYSPGGRSFLADFGRAKPGAYAMGLTRFRMDALLLDRARAAGVDVREQAHVRDLIRADGRVHGVEATIAGIRESIRAVVVVGADGHHSVVSRSLGLDHPIRWPRRTGLVAHYRGVRGLDRNGEMHVTRHGYVGLAPLEDGLTNVAVVSDSAAVTRRGGTIERYFRETLDAIPVVAGRFETAERIGPIRGVGPLARRVRKVSGDGYLLVGDAAGFLDPFTGDGMFDAMRGGQLAGPVLSAALRSGSVDAASLRPYVGARRREFWAKRQVRWIVQGFVHAPPLMNYVTYRLDEREELGETLSGVLGNVLPARLALSPLFLARLLRP